MTPRKKHLSHPKYRPDIDGLRALAVLAVVGFHAFPAWMKGGYIGVDIFFVISGFLISTILFENLDKKTFSLTEFYTRRVKRIFPSLLLVLCACLVFGWFALLPDEYQRLGKHVAGGAGFVSNLLLWSESGYFDTAAESKPLLHLWSLGIEEQFYIIWPLALWATWKSKFNPLTILCLLALSSFILNIKEMQTDTIAAFYAPHTRFWELICGSLLAWASLYKKDELNKLKIKIDRPLAVLKRDRPALSEKPLANGKTVSNVLSATGLLLLIYGFVTITKDSYFPGSLALIPVLGAVMIIAAGPSAWLNRRLFAHPLTVWFGLISFPLYLWHWPLLSFARIIEGVTPDRTLRCSAVVLAIVLAWLSYQFIEKPVRFGSRRKTVPIVLFVIMILTGSAGTLVSYQEGFATRFTTQKTLLDIVSKPYPSVASTKCSKHLGTVPMDLFEGSCWLSKDMPPTILFVGDSHADQYRTAIWEQFSSDPVMMIVGTSCLPFAADPLMNDKCTQKFEAILTLLKESPTVQTLYLTGYWSYLMTGGFEKSDGRWRMPRPINQQDLKAFKERAMRLLATAKQANKHIVLIKDIPDLDYDIHACFNIRPLRLRSKTEIRKDCSMDEAAYQVRMKSYDSVIDELVAKSPWVQTYDPRPVFCKIGKCSASDGSLPYYHNGDHLNHWGATLVIDDMRKNRSTRKP